MAGRLILMQATATAAAISFVAGASAQTLVDPTRPPSELIAAAAGSEKGAAAVAAARPRLESILLSSARKGAIINGRYVPLGASFGKATLVGITATGVTLKTGRTLQTLQLYPALDNPSAASGAGGETEKVVKRP